MKFVIRTTVNNELMSQNRRIIIFNKKEEAGWVLGGGGFPGWKIEEFDEKYNPILHITFESWIGTDTLKGNMIPESIRIY